jgi:hypothetical protein
MPRFGVLSETRLFNDRMDGLLRSFGLASGIGVGSYSRGGGLALLCTRDLKVKLQRYDKLHIDVVILNTESDEEVWRFTGFYGESRRGLRHRSWDLLRLLNDRSRIPWLCAGDFNEVLEAAEQFGGNVQPERQMDGFREAVTVCGFTDLGFSELPFTWDNRQNDAHNVKVRLDRGLANRGFLDLFPFTTVWHEQTTTSDHCCLRIEFYQHGTNRRRRCKPFRYENMWRRDKSYVDLIRSAWGEADESTDLNQLKVRLSCVQGALQDWDKNVFGSVRKNLKKLWKNHEVERGRSVGAGPSSKKRHLMSQILEWVS